MAAPETDALEADRPDGAPSRRPLSRRAALRSSRLPPSWLAALAATASVLLAAVALTALLVDARQAIDEHGYLAGWADAVRDDVGSRVAALRGTLQRWGEDGELRSLLASGDPDGWPRVEEGLLRGLPGALAVHIRSRAEAVSPRREDADLSFAGRDLIREAAQTGQPTVLEVHRVGLPDRHLAIAGPVRAAEGDGVLGVIYVAMPLSWLPDVVARGGALGRLHYLQRVGDSLAVVGADPDESLDPEAPDYQVTVPGTRLTVAAWRNAGSVDALLLIQLVGLSVALVLVTGAAIVFFARRQGSELARDMARLSALVDDAASGQPLRLQACQLGEVEAVRRRLRRLLERLTAMARGGVSLSKIGADGGHTDRLGGARGSAEGFDDLAPELKKVLSEKRRPARTGQPSKARLAAVPAELFWPNGIRGLVGETLTEKLALEIGQAVGSEVRARGERSVFVGRDNRESSDSMASAVIDGLRRSGCEVVDLGVAPTPLLYFATHYEGGRSGVMVTGGHNPPKYNGMKVVLGGETLAEERVVGLRERILWEDFTSGEGGYRQSDLVETYCADLEQDVTLARIMKVVIDCGNGSASRVAPLLYGRLGCQVAELACEIASGEAARTGNPAHPDSLHELAERVVAEQADLGLALDIDGDRLGVIDSAGHFVASDRILMLLATDILSRSPGTDVVYDVACSRHLASEVVRFGGRPVSWRSGHARLEAKLRETGGLIAGDAEGHIIVAARWHGVDDALYAGARLLELLALDPRPSEEVFAGLPASCLTPILYAPLADGDAATVMAEMNDAAARVLVGAESKTVDGLRAERGRAWGLVRPAATRPGLEMRFEADDENELRAIQEQFRRLFDEVAPNTRLPF